MLREDKVPISDDVEDAVVAFDQLGFNSQFLRQPGPQTGGTRKVVSADAIRDRDVHF
jgi:hypothetical protein